MFIAKMQQNLYALQSEMLFRYLICVFSSIECKHEPDSASTLVKPLISK